MAILYAADWKKYPTAIVHTTTKNKSFIRLSALYREMGVRNHTFLLALVNPELENIDPFSSDLTPEQMALIAYECKINPWYYFREIAKAPGRAGGDAMPFKANRGNISLLWLFLNGITTILIQIRQTGKSFTTDTLMTYLLNIRCVNTEINLLTKDDTLRSSNIERMKDIESELPFYLKQRNKADITNTEELTVKALGNRYRGHLPNKSPKLALNVGRGLTSPIFHIDEGAFLPNIGISLPAALAAGTAARDIARRNGEPYGTIITTTAGKKDDRDGRYMYQLVEESAVWTEALLDAADLDDLEHIVRKSSKTGKLRVNCTFNHRQLGYTDEWLKQAIEDAMVSGEDADRDFFNVWTAGSQRSPLAVSLLEKIRDSQRDVIFNEISSPYGYITRWWIPETDIERTMASAPHVMSVDTSDASGGDDIAVAIRNAYTGEIIATGNYNETNLITFSEWLLSWFIRFPNLVAIPERRSTASVIIDYLLLMMVSKDMDPFARIFNTIVHDREEHPERFKEIDRPLYLRSPDLIVKYKKHFGFATSGSGMASRSELYSTTLVNAAKHTGDVVKDKQTIDQILGLIEKNGRIDHGDGEHDDLVIAWLLGYWLISKGKHLDYYGINSRHILANKTVTAQNSLEQYDQTYQQSIRLDIEDAIEELASTKDPFMAMKTEARIRNLITKITLEAGEKITLDNLLNELKDARRLNGIQQQRQYYQPTHGFQSYRR